MDRDASSATAAVADLIAGIALPIIEPLATDMAALSELPPLPAPGRSGPASYSQLDGVRELMDGCGATIAAMRRHQNQCAALMAVMVERLEATAMLEGGLLSLDWWQKGCSTDQICAELATILHVSEGVAGRLVDQSVTLVRQLPATMESLSSGDLGWEHAVVIAEETTLLRNSAIEQATIDAFEQRLLQHAANKTLPSFRSTARRIRERSHPETLAARTRRAYSERNMRVSRGSDGMSWVSLFAPSPTIEAIWDQCTYTAQAARGPHEDRTLVQLRADVAAALLLRQGMDQNGINSPAPPAAPAGEPPAPAPPAPGPPAFLFPDINGGNGHSCSPTDGTGNFAASESDTGHGTAMAGAPARAVNRPDHPSWYRGPETEPCADGACPDPKRFATAFYAWQVPVFDDPDYNDPDFREPDPRNQPEWHSTAQLPVLAPAGSTSNTGSAPETGHACTDSPASVTSPARADGEPWPPLPPVLPVVLIPMFSLLGATNEPAWMEGAGPISMEVAKRLTAQAPSMLRVLVDPISNTPLDIAPDRYRVSQAMRTMLRIRDEYCQFPGCMAKAVNCDVDHVKSFESGGRSIYNNLETLCAHHHLVKHFKDDKGRNGKLRCIDEPERQGLRLRGWTPRMEEGGRVSWTSPSGRYYPPELVDELPPAYPKWLKKRIARALKRQRRMTETPAQMATPGRPTQRATADQSAEQATAQHATAGQAAGQSPDPAWISTRVPLLGNIWDCSTAFELPDDLPAEDADFQVAGEALPLSGDDDEILTRLAIERGLSHPGWGLADAA